MKKLVISALCVLFAACLALQIGVLWNFQKAEPRVEIVFEGAIPAEAKTALARYAPSEDGNMLVIDGAKGGLFLAKEAESVLKQASVEGFRVNDRSQAEKLAKQSLSIFIFALGIIAFVMMIKYLLRDVRRLRGIYKDAMQTLYPHEFFSSNVELVLVSSIKWAVMLALLVVILAKLIGFAFYVPPQFVPPQYILDFKYYFTIGYEAVSSSDYEQLCRVTLPSLYVLCAANIALATTFSALIWRKLKGEKHGKGDNEKSVQNLSE